MRKRLLFGMLICFIILCTAFTACRKKKPQEAVTVEITETPTITPTMPPEDSREDTKDEPAPVVTEKPDEGSETTEETYLSEAEAEKIVHKKIDERGYFLELIEKHLNIGDKSYFIYQISDGTSAIEPNVIVDKVSGELLCYYSDGSTASFSEFPLYTEIDAASQNTNEFTKEDASEKLSKLTAKELGLPAKLTEYTIVYDDWTTNINGVECYGINAFADLGEKMTNMGVFYVAVDGTKMFKFDSLLDDFVELKD